MIETRFEGISPEHLPFCEFPQDECVVVVFANAADAEHVADVYKKSKYRNSVTLLKFFDSDVYEPSFPDTEVYKSRSVALQRILQKDVNIIITSIPALNFKLPSPDFYERRIILEAGTQVNISDLINTLINFGYYRSEIVADTGTFAVRGGIIDVFVPYAPSPVRIDFIGNEIETLKEFNVSTQMTEKRVDRITILKCTEILINERSKHIFKEKYRFKDDHIKETVVNGNFFPGIEWFHSCFNEEMVNILDYLPNDTKFIFDFELEKYNKIFFNECENKYKDAHNVLPIHEIFTDVIEQITRQYTVYSLNPYMQNKNFGKHNKRYNIRIESELQTILRTASSKTIFSLKTNGAMNIAKDLLHDVKIHEIKNFDEAVDGSINIILSELDIGFDSDQLTVYTEQELFGENLRFRKKHNKENFFKDYSHLSVGDFVVHEKYGIGVFEGLQNIILSEIPHDFVILQYQNNDKLYVPVENINLISRYGDANTDVPLDYLRSTAWATRKQKVYKKLLVIANDLLQLAAKRKMNKVTPYEIPENYDAFCKNFGYIETDDQLSAIDDILSDLTGDIPADRLICGDVGFGKTEVALRASFIVASALKQVVLLAPTTILVSQHYKNFKKRFAGFDIEICQLSRFVTKTQFQKNLADIKAGKAQIIIATHAVLSEKIEFADLGLVIIDEEQHFGVKQKEFLKRYHEKAHFITLSATPIPRTLQLAMTGVKDLSMITTPPTNRRSVRMLICTFCKETFKQAIDKETKLGGQVFIVTPRVEFLDELYNFVSGLFPNLKIAKVHGKTANLEETIRDFCDYKIDVLISTNIIDSGIDIPNANTIIIHRFDLFGLSQLYQLRGRVGRSVRQAYAYLLLDETKVLSDAAKKRLEVLSNLYKLGSGFNLSAYDLDIRGAGNLLGEEQSGYIKEVGIELYQSMLQETILMLKSGNNLETQNKIDIQVNLGVPAMIPEFYINDSSLRLEIYRRIGGLSSEEQIKATEFELYDRFGGVPCEIKNLLILINIKLLCLKLRIDKLDVGANGFTFSFFENKCGFTEELLYYLGQLLGNSNFKLHSDNKIVILGKWKTLDERTNSVLKFIRDLSIHLQQNI
ncbi:MAG: transcription-repair coupling factor [Alphaproteobacteria bacterium]|nr:transcription-repair coupling factor [Alphaproteobacteria bacterium]